jgi:ribosomal protein S18 acetylase RimI-like enzyme
MVTVEFAKPVDRLDVERLIAAYHSSEGLPPNLERISWAVDQYLENRFPSVILVARQDHATIGVAVAVYSTSAELGRLLVVNDFYVEPNVRRSRVGTALAMKLVEVAKDAKADRIDLEILPTNATAIAFWKSVGFRTFGRTIYSRDLEG